MECDVINLATPNGYHCSYAIKLLEAHCHVVIEKPMGLNHAESTEFEDSGLVNFEFMNGGLGFINFSTAVWDTNMESSITVVGS